MAFKPRSLSVLAYANGFTLWLYKTRDRLCDVEDDAYFAAAGRKHVMLRNENDDSDAEE